MNANRSVLFTVFLVVLVDLMGFGIILPLLPFFAAKFQAGPVEIGLIYSCYSSMQLLFSPVWGAWSDKIGRRPIMLLSTFGSSFSYILFAFCGSLPVLFMSRILAGLMGGNISAAQAAVADVTPPAERAKGMGLIGAAFGIGFMVGPAIAGILSAKMLSPLVGADVRSFLETHPFRLPGLFAAALSAASFLLVLTRLPETRVAGAASDAMRIEKTGIFSSRFWKNFSSGSAHLPLLFGAALILAIGQSSLYSSFPLFCEQTLGFDAHAIAMQFAVMGLIAVFIQGGLIRMLVKRLPERAIFAAGCVLMAAGLALIPLARTPGQLTFYLSVLAVGGSLNGPTLTSLLSQEAGPGRFGSVMGTSQGLSALGRVIGPTWGGWLFSFARPLPFWATAALVSTTFWIAAKLAAPIKGSSA